MLMRSTPAPDTHPGIEKHTDSKPQLSLIGAASSLGCPKPGCEQSPEQLQKLGLIETLEMNGIAAHWETLLKTVPGPSVTQAVAEFSQRLAASVTKQLTDKHFFAVIGGDHSCAIGTWNGVYGARYGEPFGLIWVDAHMDSHTPNSSHSGALHGMPLAALLGFGDEALTGLAQPGPVLQPEHLCLLGVRSYEAEEAELLENLGVRVFDMQEIAQRGMEAVMNEALDIVRAAGNFGLSIDLDALDPELAPAVSIPEPGGLKLKHLNELLKPLPQTPGFLGIEIAEFNPRFDQQHKTARLISTILSACTPRHSGGNA
jgi:arginase